MENLRERQAQLTDQIKELFEGFQMPCELHEEEYIGKMIFCEHPNFDINNEPAVGVYHFVPQVEEESNIMRFMISIALNDEVSPIADFMLRTELSRLNYILPAGAFVLSPDGEVLSYRDIMTVSPKLSDEDIVSMVFEEIVLGLSLSSVWMDALNQLTYGALSPDDFEAMLADHETIMNEND